MTAEPPTQDNIVAYWGVAVILDGYDDWWLLMPDKGYTSKVELMNGGKLKVRGHWLYPTQEYPVGDTADRIFEKKGKDTVSVYSVIYEGIALRALGGGKFEMPSATVVGVNGAFQWVNDQEAKAAAIREEEELLLPRPVAVVAEEAADVVEELGTTTDPEEHELLVSVPLAVSIAEEAPIDVDATPTAVMMLAEEEEDEDALQTIPEAHTLLVVRDRKGGVVPAYWDGTLLIPLAESKIDGDVIVWRLGRNRRQFTLGPDSGTEVLEVLGPCDPATHVDITNYQLCVHGETLLNTWIKPKRSLTLPERVLSDWLHTPSEPLAPFRSKEWVDQKIAQSLAAEEEVLSCLI